MHIYKNTRTMIINSSNFRQLNKHSKLTERCTEVRVSIEGLHTALVAEVPDAQRFVIAGGKHVLATRMEHDAPYPVVMTDECEQAQPGADIPNLVEKTSALEIVETKNPNKLKRQLTLMVLSLDPDARNGPWCAPFLLSAPAASLMAAAADSGAQAIHSTVFSCSRSSAWNY